MPNVAQSSSSSTSSKPSNVGGISLASIIRRPQSTGFYVDMSTAPPPAGAATTQQTQQCAAADRRSNSTEGRSGSPGRVADRSHLFSMFIDFAEPSIHSPAKRAAAAPTATGTADDVTGVVQLRRRAERALDSVGTASSRQSWSNCGATDAGVFSFDTMPAGAGGAHGTNMTELEDSCTASVVSADHGYQSMPMQLAGRPSRSRNSVQSLDHSTNSMGSSREDLTAGVRGALAAVVAAAPQPPARKSRRTLHQQQKQQQQRRHPDHDPDHDGDDDDDLELERYSKDSVESLCRRESSFSDAEEATGVRADRRSTHSSYGDQLDGLHSAANVGSSKLPVVAHQLRKNNSLSHVGEQMLLRAANRNQPHAATATAATGDGHPQHGQHHPHHHSGHTMETLQATMERQQKLLLLETVNEETPLSSFVKLSDMDRQPERAADGSAAVADAKLMSRSSGPGGKVMERAASVGRSSMSRSMGEC